MRRLVPLLSLLVVASLGCTSSYTRDVPPVPPGTIDVIGTWEDCAQTLTFAAGGAATLVNHRQSCMTSGTFGVDGNVLEVTWADAACVREAHWIRELLRPDGALVMVDPITAATTRFADERTPRSRWLFVGTDPPLSSTVRIVGTPGVGAGSGCYWSTDGMCGGFFSCSGSMLSWTEDAATGIHATTGCSGECPCGAIIDATESATGTFAGTYRGASCERTLSGALSITRLTD